MDEKYSQWLEVISKHFKEGDDISVALIQKKCRFTWNESDAILRKLIDNRIVSFLARNGVRRYM
jgi:hypothetical protein